MYLRLILIIALYIPVFDCIASDKPNEKVLKLYHDADWSHNVESAESIWRGVNTALSEVNYQTQGYRIEMVKKDHSGNVIRSLHNMNDFLKDNQALALVSGIHSPPLIKHRDFINRNKLLTLVPWAAGGPITRHPSTENWVFRVSVDDTKAGKVLIDYAAKDKGCKTPHLLLENTAWGQSNQKNMIQAFNEYGRGSAHVTRFDWSMKSYSARSKLQKIIEQDNADCILLVANTIEGIEIAKAMASMPAAKRLPIISHWGIVGGNFHKKINDSIRQQLDISFIQSCFSFMTPKLSKKGQQVFDLAKQVYPKEIKEVSDIRSPDGFIHGYDMTLLLLNALQNISLTEDMLSNRNALRLALESIDGPVEGLVKVYQNPFSIFSNSNFDAHEALNTEDYCMAHYGTDDEIILSTTRRPY